MPAPATSNMCTMHEDHKKFMPPTFSLSCLRSSRISASLAARVPLSASTSTCPARISSSRSSAQVASAHVRAPRKA